MWEYVIQFCHAVIAYFAKFIDVLHTDTFFFFYKALIPHIKKEEIA